MIARPKQGASQLISQSGVIPYRIRRGRVEVALVTASSGPHWTIPKGHIEPDMSPEQSAAKEAYEESGLLGDVGRRCIGRYVYEKRGALRQVAIFPMAVREELDRWPEMKVRQRRWMSVKEAASCVRSAELRCCIQSFVNLVMSPSARGVRRAAAA
jgi:8-oxo-dGTP pyrophosphatase MutT (NUDIX family)